MNDSLLITEEVSAALAAGQAVVALESTVISHGLPYPDNLHLARELESIIRAGRCVPATVALAGGRVHIGLDDGLLEDLATSAQVRKVSRRDFGPVLASGDLGATTVAGTMIAAQLAGIRVFATGGIGGVHRGGQDSLDISADLHELARSDVAVVCAGPKAILDLNRTMEVLESLGVPVIGYGCDELPAFYYPGSGVPLEQRVDSPEQLAEIMLAKWGLGLSGGLLVVQPPPAEAALPADEMEAQIEGALAEAQAQGVSGKSLTPFLLRQLNRHDQRSLATNLALLRNNAELAARLADAHCRLDRPRSRKG